MFKGLCSFLQPYFSLLLRCSLWDIFYLGADRSFPLDPGLKIETCILIFLQFTPRLKSERVQSLHVIAPSVFFHLFTFSS